jgi:hypothetical protein
MDSVSASVAVPKMSSTEQRRIADNLNRNKQTARLAMAGSSRNRFYAGSSISSSGRHETSSLRTNVFNNDNVLADNLRQSQQISRQNLIIESKNKVIQKITYPFRRLSSKALIRYWKLLIESFGATLILIDFHVFGRYILGESLFVKLGHEWVEMVSSGLGNSKYKNELIERLCSKIGPVEATVVFLLNIVVLLIIIAGLSILVFIVATVISPFYSTIQIIEWLSKQIF